MIQWQRRCYVLQDPEAVEENVTPVIDEPFPFTDLAFPYPLLIIPNGGVDIGIQQLIPIETVLLQGVLEILMNLRSGGVFGHC